MRGFDAVAARYDELWTRTPIGRHQRDAVWRRIDPFLRPGETILDLGCGAGEDALHFMSAGTRVRAIDASAEMVRIARSRGVDATQLTIEELDRVPGCFDAVISNFGALNCVHAMDAIRAPLARLVRPGGHLAICVMGRFCLWETAWYLSKARPRKAFRRWNRDGAATSLGMRVFYPSIRQLKQAFQPDFQIVEWYGVGITVPPSYIRGLSNDTLANLAAFDRRVEHLPLWRALSDHRLIIFQRT